MLTGGVDANALQKPKRFFGAARNIANKRIYPAVNLTASSTRRDDLLQDSETINFMQQYRNHLADMNPVEAITFIVRQMNNTYNNQEFLLSANQ